MKTETIFWVIVGLAIVAFVLAMIKCVKLFIKMMKEEKELNK